MNKFTSLKLATAVLLSAVALAPTVVHAAGSATLTMNGGGTITTGSQTSISFVENSGADTVNSAQVDLAYNVGNLQFVGFTASAPFSCPIVDSTTTNKISAGCFIPAGSTTGAQVIGTATFRAVSGSGSDAVRLLDSSLIANTAGTDIWNHAASASNYSFTPAAGGRGGSGAAPVAPQPQVLSAATTAPDPTPAPTPAPVVAAPVKKAMVTPIVATTATAASQKHQSKAGETIFSLIVLALLILGAIAIAKREQLAKWYDGKKKLNAKGAAKVAVPAAAAVVAAKAVTKKKAPAKKPVAKKTVAKKPTAKKSITKK
jgi:hypothetical protein